MTTDTVYLHFIFKFHSFFVTRPYAAAATTTTVLWSLWLQASDRATEEKKTRDRVTEKFHYKWRMRNKSRTMNNFFLFHFFSPSSLSTSIWSLTSPIYLYRGSQLFSFFRVAFLLCAAKSNCNKNQFSVWLLRFFLCSVAAREKYAISFPLSSCRFHQKQSVFASMDTCDKSLTVYSNPLGYWKCYLSEKIVSAGWLNCCSRLDFYRNVFWRFWNRSNRGTHRLYLWRRSDLFRSINETKKQQELSKDKEKKRLDW